MVRLVVERVHGLIKHAGRNDLIVDIDKIYQCISINKEYIKPNSIKNNVFKN